jgi:hypothetical protein
MLSSLTEAKLYVFCLSSSTRRGEKEEEEEEEEEEGGYPWTLARKNKKKDTKHVICTQGILLIMLWKVKSKSGKRENKKGENEEKQLTNVSLGREEKRLPRWGRRSRRRRSEVSLRQEALQRVVYRQGPRAVPWVGCAARHRRYALSGKRLTVVDPQVPARRRVTCIASMDS